MSLIKWEKKYETGIAEVDSQHRMLCDMINRLHDAMIDQKTEKVVDKILIELLNYTEYHFGLEESMLRKARYSQLNEHIQEHTEFIEKIVHFTTEITKGRVLLSMDIINFLKDWLIGHISGSDMDYVPHLNAKGIG